MKVVFALLGLVYVASAAPGDIGLFSSIIIGDNLYFTDATLRTRSEALTYCQSQDGQLGQITDKIVYNKIRLSVSTVATYWIDGIDKTTADRFALDESCNPSSMDLTDVPNLIQSTSCLALVKANTAANSTLIAAPCTNKYQTLCSFPLNGCTVVPGPDPIEGEDGKI